MGEKRNQVDLLSDDWCTGWDTGGQSQLCEEEKQRKREWEVNFHLQWPVHIN